MHTQVAPEKSSDVCLAADAYILIDHMPHVDLTGCYQMTFDEIEKSLFGKNTYASLFEDAGIGLTDKFFIFESYIYLKEFADLNNVIFFPEFFYAAAKIAEKAQLGRIDFTQKQKSFNCPMHNYRYNRVLASCWLYNHQKLLNFTYTQSWEASEYEAVLFELLKLGKLATWQGAKYNIKNLDKQYILTDLDAPRLYSEIGEFRNMFIESAVSVILGATFWEYGCTLDEKYLNAVCSGTIPICDAYRFFDTMRQIGFDTFDDIIDTSSQYELNPVLRTWNMFENNKHLLTNGLDYVRHPEIQERLINNYLLVKNADQWLNTAFNNLNTSEAKAQYLSKYQHCGKIYDSTWPLLNV